MREAGTAFVASNVAVTNYTGGDPTGQDLLLHAHQTVAQRYDERLIVWVNIPTGAAAAAATGTVITARESALENRTQRVETFTARTRALSAWPAGSVIDDTTARARPQPGQYVWTGSRQIGVEGRQLDPEDIKKLEFLVETREADTDDWKFLQKKGLDCYTHATQALNYQDQRWTAGGGFNVAHVWFPPNGTDEGTFRLTYTMKLCDKDVRRWRTVVEVRD